MTQPQLLSQTTVKLGFPNLIVVEADDVQFPQVSGSNLLRMPVQVPDAFEGSLNVVFVAFQRWQQNDIDGWLPLITKMEEIYSGLLAYELPVIEKLNRVSRFFINEGMRAGIPNHDTRARTITLYTDKASFRRQLRLPGEDTMYVLLVNDSGQVVWRTEGPMTTEKANQLIQEIDVRSHL